MKKLLAVGIILFSVLFAKEDVNVYTYHKHAPFILDKNQGLTYELVNLLNKNSKDYNFIVKVVPRSRLNYILKPWINKECNTNNKCASNWMVLWVNHKWGFGKDSLENFSWTPLLEDSNAIVSKKGSGFIYKNPNSLIGKTLAGVSGHKYIGIDDLVKEGKIKRINGKNEKENLLKVWANRVDATLLPSSSFKYYKTTNKRFEDLEESEVAHQVYMRNIMTNKKDKELIKYLNSLDFKVLFK